MEFKQIVQWLLSNSYLVFINNRPVLTSKFEKEVGYVPTEPLPAPVPDMNWVIDIGSTESTSAATMKRITDPKLAWNTFIIDAEIPHRVKTTDNKTYTVRQYGSNVARKLLKIIQDPSIDYWRLVESTKNYYAVTSYKALLSNYIDKGIWEQEYKEWDKTKKNVTPSDGGNRWESE